MLETRKPPASPRIRPADASRRSPDTRRPATVRSAGNAALRRELDIPPRPTPVARPNRLGRSEMRLMGLATVCTAVVCGLLLLYLAAYAHVTRLGIDQANARAQLRQSRLKNEMPSRGTRPSAKPAARYCCRHRDGHDHARVDAGGISFRVLFDRSAGQPPRKSQRPRRAASSRSGNTRWHDRRQPHSSIFPLLSPARLWYLSLWQAFI